MLDLPTDEVPRAAGALVAAVGMLEHGQRVDHDAKRVAQLVRQHRQEVVLGAAGGLHLAVEAGVLDGLAGPPRQLLGELDVVLRVDPAGFDAGDEQQRAEHPIVRHQRHRHRRARLERAHHRQMLGVVG